MKLKFEPNPSCWFCQQGHCILKKKGGLCCFRWCYQPEIEGIYNVKDYIDLIKNSKAAFRADIALLISIMVVLFEFFKIYIDSIS